MQDTKQVDLTKVDHYRRAESLLDNDGFDHPAPYNVNEAIAHALLALVDVTRQIEADDAKLASVVDPDGSRLRVAARAL